MTGFKPHPLDASLAAMVDAMNNADKQMTAMSQGIGDFDSRKLTPAEDDLVFHNPHLRYLGQVEPTTGLPYTNAQAAQKLLAEVGPTEYVNYIKDYVSRADRRQGSTVNGG